MKKLLLLAALLVAGASPAGAQAAEKHFTITGGGPRLGVQVTPLTEELRAFFGAQKESGLLIGKLEAGGAAEKAGLRVVVPRPDALDADREEGGPEPAEELECGAPASPPRS